MRSRTIRKGMLCVSEDKRYFRIGEIMGEAVKLARQDPRFTAADQNCALENDGVCITTRFDEVRLCSFDVIGYRYTEVAKGSMAISTSTASGCLSKRWNRSIPKCGYM